MTELTRTNKGAGVTDVQQLCSSAASAGETALKLFANRPYVELAVQDKAAGFRSPVTRADRAREDAIRAVSVRARPDDSILGEEQDYSDGRSGVLWLIDPLDGTTNFARGGTRYAVTAAAVEDYRTGFPLSGRVVAATVLKSATGEMLQLPVQGVARSGSQSLRSSLVGFASPRATRARRLAYSLVGQLAAVAQDLRLSGSTVCDLADVASGHLDCVHLCRPRPLGCRSWCRTSASGGRHRYFVRSAERRSGSCRGRSSGGEGGSGHPAHVWIQQPWALICVPFDSIP